MVLSTKGTLTLIENLARASQALLSSPEKLYDDHISAVLSAPIQQLYDHLFSKQNLMIRNILANLTSNNLRLRESNNLRLGVYVTRGHSESFVSDLEQVKEGKCGAGFALCVQNLFIILQSHVNFTLAFKLSKTSSKSIETEHENKREEALIIKKALSEKISSSDTEAEKRDAGVQRIIDAVDTLRKNYEQFSRKTNKDELDKLQLAVFNASYDPNRKNKIEYMITLLESAFLEQLSKYTKGFLGISQKKPEDYAAFLESRKDDYLYPYLLAVALKKLYGDLELKPNGRIEGIIVKINEERMKNLRMIDRT